MLRVLSVERLLIAMPLFFHARAMPLCSMLMRYAAFAGALRYAATHCHACMLAVCASRHLPPAGRRYAMPTWRYTSATRVFDADSMLFSVDDAAPPARDSRFCRRLRRAFA